MKTLQDLVKKWREIADYDSTGSAQRETLVECASELETAIEIVVLPKEH